MKATASADAATAVAGLSPADERAAVDRARSGDVAAFERLYRAHAPRVYALCLRLSGSASAADDFAQEAFVRAWRSLPRFRGESAFSTWVHRIAVNVVLGHRRSRAFWTGTESEPPDIAAPSVRPGLKMDLEGAIAGLPPGARTVFVLHDVEGYRHEEIASLAGIAVGTSKAHLHRARRLLREALER